MIAQQKRLKQIRNKSKHCHTDRVKGTEVSLKVEAMPMLQEVNCRLVFTC